MLALVGFHHDRAARIVAGESDDFARLHGLRHGSTGSKRECSRGGCQPSCQMHGWTVFVDRCPVIDGPDLPRILVRSGSLTMIIKLQRELSQNRVRGGAIDEEFRRLCYARHSCGANESLG